MGYSNLQQKSKVTSSIYIVKLHLTGKKRTKRGEGTNDRRNEMLSPGETSGFDKSTLAAHQPEKMTNSKQNDNGKRVRE